MTMLNDLEFLNSTAIETVSGMLVDPWDPDPTQIHIADIALGLSRVARFGGHTNRNWSVAQHSIMVAQRLPPELQLTGLLHDATEAYMGDLIRPFKKRCPNYMVGEERLARCIAERFGLQYPWHPEVKKVDDEVLLLERRMLKLGDTSVALGPLALLTQEGVRKEFMQLFDRLSLPHDEQEPEFRTVH